MTEISRREFNRLMGAAAIGGALPSLGSPRAALAQGSELVFMPATELAARLRRKDVSAREVLSAHIAHIERANPRLNAIVTTAFERAMADAARADESMARGTPLGPLHGLPIAHKTSSRPKGSARHAALPFIGTSFLRETLRSCGACARQAQSR